MRRRSRLASAACRSALVPSWSSAWLTVSTIASACVVLMPAAVRRLIAAWVSRAVAMFASYHFVVPRPVPGSVRQNAHSVSRCRGFSAETNDVWRGGLLSARRFTPTPTRPPGIRPDRQFRWLVRRWRLAPPLGKGLLGRQGSARGTAPPSISIAATSRKPASAAWSSGVVQVSLRTLGLAPAARSASTAAAKPPPAAQCSGVQSQT